jgi:type IV secretion system protein VirB10
MTNHEQSPDVLRPDAGVKRLNRRPLAIIVVMLAVIVLVLAYGVASRSRRSTSRPLRTNQKHTVQPARPAAVALAKDAPKAGPIPEQPVAERFRGGQRGGLILPEPEAPKPTPASNVDREAELEQRRRWADRRRQMHETALTAVTRVATVEELASRTARREPTREIDTAATGGVTPGGSAAALRAGLAGLPGTEDVNKQGDKIAFAEQKRPVGYLAGTRQPPFSPCELKAGTVIPAVLISGINSDLPGQILAQVSQDIYDSATGNHLVVPQGAKLVGAYDSRISVGQSRVQVVWTRLNFPDGSTLDLGSMPGTDPTGASGFHDRVNNHVFRIFRDALMLSLISAGAQLSQPRTRGTEGRLSAEEQIAAAMGQQFGAAGMELAKRNAHIQPTLEIRPGFQLTVMVTKDVILPPYARPDR